MLSERKKKDVASDNNFVGWDKSLASMLSDFYLIVLAFKSSLTVRGDKPGELSVLLFQPNGKQPTRSRL